MRGNDVCYARKIGAPFPEGCCLTAITAKPQGKTCAEMDAEFSDTEPPPCDGTGMFLTFVLKIKTAINKVNNGTSAFKIPVSELSSCVCALVNKKAGIPLPNNPTTANGSQKCLGVFLICLQTKGSSESQAKPMRISATWV